MTRSVGVTGQTLLTRPWSWEDRVQAVIVDALIRDGWAIRSVADTASRAAGEDVEAGAGEP